MGKGPRQVVGCVPVRNGQVLLITSRKASYKWCLPKGGWEVGESMQDGAARETWEEAGVKGKVAQEALGRTEGLDKSERLCVFTFFTLDVTEELADWPERHERKREWVSLDAAQQMLTHPAFVNAIAQYRQRHGQ